MTAFKNYCEVYRVPWKLQIVTIPSGAERVFSWGRAMGWVRGDGASSSNYRMSGRGDPKAIQDGPSPHPGLTTHFSAEAAAPGDGPGGAPTSTHVKGWLTGWSQPRRGSLGFNENMSGTHPLSAMDEDSMEAPTMGHGSGVLPPVTHDPVQDSAIVIPKSSVTNFQRVLLNDTPANPASPSSVQEPSFR